MNIPPEFIKDYHRQYQGDAMTLFVNPVNIEYLKDKLKDVDFDQDVILRYISNFRFPFYEQFKYKEPKDLLNAYNTVLLNNIRHVAIHEKREEKDAVPDKWKYGLTEESFKDGYYTPEDYFMNNCFNKEPAWKRRVIDLATYRNDNYFKAVYGEPTKENPPHPGHNPWFVFNKYNRNYDYDASGQGLVMDGMCDRFVRASDPRYPLEELKKKFSSTPHIDYADILPDGSI